MNEIVKVCKVHGNLTEGECFVVKKSRQIRCRKCRYEYHKKYQEGYEFKKNYYNPEKNREYYRVYYSKNREKILNSAKKNIDKIKNYRKEYKEKNLEKVKEYYKKYREKNLEKIRASQRKYARKFYLKNKEKISLQAKEYRKNYSDRINATQRRHRDKLTNAYVKSIILGKKYKKGVDLPVDIINIKREIIRIRRMYRKSKQTQSA